MNDGCPTCGKAFAGSPIVWRDGGIDYCSNVCWRTVTNGWLNVGDYPPPENKTILLVVEGETGRRYLEVGRCLPAKDYRIETTGYILARLDATLGIWTYSKVTHWLTIPELPKVQDA